MKAVRILNIIGKAYLYLVGAFFVLMAVDCFGSLGCPDCNSIWEQLLCFGISIIPGAIIVGVNYFLRHRENILGVILIVLAIVSFIFFRFYIEPLDKLPTSIIVSILPLAIGIMFIVTYGKKQE